jgi:hypothetical protein
MKKYYFSLIFLFISILSYAQYDFLKESLIVSSAPSYLVVKVKSPSYEGEAITKYGDLYSYYKTINKKSTKGNKYRKLIYRDIKCGKCFIVSDEDFEIKYGQYQPYYFEKIIMNDSVLNISKKGIDFFIRTYFDDKGDFNPPPLYNPDDFYTIVKVMFDAGIKTGIGSEWSNYHIQDARFYYRENENEAVKFVIPPEYRNK